VTTYLDRLAKRSAAVGSVLCVGVDPDPERLPDEFPRDLDGIERFATILVEATMPYAAAIKPNLASSVPMP
jgi:orotidine-5'-phosphate decarboxylase